MMLHTGNNTTTDKDDNTISRKQKVQRTGEESALSQRCVQDHKNDEREANLFLA